jgi:hypothetical protein
MFDTFPLQVFGLHFRALAVTPQLQTHLLPGVEAIPVGQGVYPMASSAVASDLMMTSSFRAFTAKRKRNACFPKVHPGAHS